MYGRRYPFNCRVKRDRVQSYFYDGPRNGSRGYDNDWRYGRDGYYGYDRDYRKHHDNDDGEKIAIGVGLAALAAVAIAAAANQSESGNQGAYAEGVEKTDLEDACGEALGRRIRHEHDGVDKVAMDYSNLTHKGNTLSGNGRIVWYRRHASDMDFTCHFDNQGRVIDSSYKFY